MTAKSDKISLSVMSVLFIATYHKFVSGSFTIRTACHLVFFCCGHRQGKRAFYYRKKLKYEQQNLGSLFQAAEGADDAVCVGTYKCKKSVLGKLFRTSADS